MLGYYHIMGIFGVTEVVVDLGQYFTGGTNGEYIDENNNAVTLVKRDSLDGLDGYTKYTHTLQSSMVYSYGIYRITHRGVTQSGFKENLSSHHTVTAYYSSEDKESLCPLIIDIGGSFYEMITKRGAWVRCDSPVVSQSILDILHNHWNKSVTLRIEKMQSYESVSVSVDGPPEPGGYLKITHTFMKEAQIVKVMYNDKPTTGLPERCPQNVIAVSVYYWAPLGASGRPLLVKITQRNHRCTTYEWFENTGYYDNTNWTSLDPTKLKDANLKDKLDLLNCHVSGVVQIDVTKTNPYCHDAHDVKRISVDNLTSKSPYNNGNFTNYNIYQHTPNARDSLIVSAFASGGKELSGIVPSAGYIKDVKEVHLFFCGSKPEDPLLIYYKAGGTNHWFKKNGSSSTWTSTLSGQHPTSHAKVHAELDSICDKCSP